MKTILAAVMALGLSFLANASADEAALGEVKTAINDLNEAFTKSDASAIKRLMADDHVAVTPYYGSPQSKEEQLRNLGNLKLTEYTSTMMKVKLLAADTALVTYRLRMKGAYKGTAVSPRSFASAIWVKREGRWVELFYQETPLTEQ